MDNKSLDGSLIKAYLLGKLVEEERQEFERRIMTDNDLYNQVLLAEDELVEEYALGRLTGEEKERFEAGFLSTDEGREQVSITSDLIIYASRQSAVEPASESKQVQPLRRKQPFFASYAGMLAAAVIILAAGLGIWRLFIYESDLDKGMASLKSAYRDGRPLEARLTGFDYAPTQILRGDDQVNVDKRARNRAERILLDEVIENPGSASHHALGQLYLSERKFDDAIRQFEEALKADPNNARAHSDLGAALFERGRSLAASNEDGRNIEAFAESLTHLNRALALDPNLRESLFNRALLRQQMMLSESAAEDWRAYIEKDSSSQWADEARKNLEKLEQRKHQNEQGRQNLVEDFLNAWRARDPERAWGLFSPNRENLTTKLLALHLENAAQLRQGSKPDALDALIYVGDLDVTRTGDRYAADLAGFYRSASRQQLVAAGDAHKLMLRARARYGESKHEEAIAAYDNARRVFTKIGDRCGARLAALWLGLCYWELTQTARSHAMWMRLVEDCRAEEHLWLQARTLNMLSGTAFKGDEYSRAIAYSDQAYRLAEQINDQPSAFSAACALIEYYRLLGNQSACLAQVGRGLPRLNKTGIGVISLWRYYDFVATAHNTFGLYEAAIDYQREAQRFAAASGNHVLMAAAYINLSSIYGKLQDFDAAFKHAEEAYEIGVAHASEALGQLIMAQANAQRGHLHRERGEFASALAFYDQAVELHRTNNLDFSVHLYQSYRGRLACNIALKDTAAAQSQLATLLDVMDKHRAAIIEEENRDSFFAVEQSVYDLGIDLAYSQQQDWRQAFAFAEASRARSLLDSMNAAPQVVKRGGNPDLLLQATAQPLPLDELKARIPDRACLLYYAVLDDKLIIWVLSRARADHVEVNISQTALTDAINEYCAVVQRSSEESYAAAARLARELYGHLLTPVETMISGSQSLYIVPDKALNRLPWDALISPDGRFVMEDYQVTLTPSATLFAVCTDLASQKSDARAERVVSVGDPHFDRESFPELAPLLDAAREADRVASFYTSKSVLLGPAAREQAVRDAMENADIAHFALHCVVNQRSAIRSMMVLAKEPASGGSTQASDGLLQAHEIYNIKLPRTRLAVLSACQTGIEHFYRGEGMIGMARAFLVARVPIVVASLWPVDSGATAELMIRFHEYRKRGGLPVHEALRLAKRDLLQGPVERYRKPAFWAAFQAIGGYVRY